jgi:2-polyprenyl-3-methyl-5-hydroxy-6-metoxy-1,4-benzoquinol methylase
MKNIAVMTKKNHHSFEIRSGKRFAFGSNWNKFLRQLDDHRIHAAEKDLQSFLNTDRLDGKTFLDIGSGSGLSSLAAYRLGATVFSFDYDPQSVACTDELRQRYAPNDTRWEVASGSVLDKKYLATLGTFDIVYSWGVLHHTGAMWNALENTASMVKLKGTLFIAIYNDQGRASKVWLRVKKSYCTITPPLRFLIIAPSMIRLWGPTIIRDIMRGKPLHSWNNYGKSERRGMDPWRDAIDWIGGLPFEVASPEAIFEFYRDRGFSLTKLKTCAGGLGCNQFVFRKE